MNINLFTIITFFQESRFDVRKRYLETARVASLLQAAREMEELYHHKLSKDLAEVVLIKQLEDDGIYNVLCDMKRILISDGIQMPGIPAIPIPAVDQSDMKLLDPCSGYRVHVANFPMHLLEASKRHAHALHKSIKRCLLKNNC